MSFSISYRFLAKFHSLSPSMQLCSCEETQHHTRNRECLLKLPLNELQRDRFCFRIGLKNASKCLNNNVLRMVSFDFDSLRLLLHCACY